ncbi:MAG: ABC transporter permease subunit [Actinomycetes bacterium]
MATSVVSPADASLRESGSQPLSRRGRRRELLIAAGFLAPALILLGALVVYPMVYTLVRSFYSARGDEFVGWDNYVTMFTSDSTFTAIRNNIIWVVVAPVLCTSLGLIFAVLMDRIRWSTAFKLIIFMPMAISMLAAGVIFRGMFQEDPEIGVVNAVVVAAKEAFSDTSSYPGAKPRPDVGVSVDRDLISADASLAPGESQDFPLVGIRVTDLPDDSTQAAPAPAASDGQITGTVWLDFVPGGGGVNGQIDPGEAGLPGVRVDVVGPDGVAGSAITEADGTYVVEGLDPGEYRVALPAANFTTGASGVPWLSSTFITAVVILSYVWIWAGFAMVMIASGLSAMDRTLQEAARVDGATEWKVFTRITVPLLAPVLVVVFVTLIINVLKIFDLVYVIPPGNAKPAANVIAVEMWTVSFGGGNNQGLGSALAILLLVMVLPFMWINVRRFKAEREG